MASGRNDKPKGDKMGSAYTAAATAQPRLPGWVPTPVRAYLAHTEGGIGIRALARGAGCHPSTVLRQVRRTETLRDDPLADAGLTRLGRLWTQHTGATPAIFSAQDLLPMTDKTSADTTFARDCLRVLKALMEPKSLLVIADGVEDGVVVHDAGGDRPVRRAVVGRDVAEALVLRDFIAGRQTGRLARYTITAAGRAEVGRLMAESESRRASLAGQAEDADADTGRDLFAPGARPAATRRSVGTDAPLHVLARRSRTDGEAWLPRELVTAALRFRETWEIARIGGGLTRDWDALVTGRVAAGGGKSHPAGAPTRRLEAEQSLEAAIRALGPDLAETVLLGVCQEQGMEDIEKRLAYPARSGKIVLRIALRTLARHYEATGSAGYDMIY
jgi:Domain of unknown function (DUF6456)